MSVRKSTYVFEYRITFLGAEKVGKSSLIRQFTDKEFVSEYSATTEDHLTHVIEHDGNICVCLFVDTAGTDDFPAMRKLSVTKGNAFIVVYAIDDYKSFERAKMFVDEIKSLKLNSAEVKISVIGNKTDNESNRQVSYNEAFNYTANLHEGNVIASFAETSAKDHESIGGVIHKLLTMFIPPPSQVEVPVMTGKKFERRLSLSKIKLRQRRTSKGLIERKHSESSENEKKDSLSDTEIQNQLPAPSKTTSKFFRKRSDSQPAVKTPFIDIYGPPPIHRTTPRFLRKMSPVNSIAEIGTPTLVSHSSTLSRYNLKKPRSISVTSNSSTDSGVSGDCNSPDRSPVNSPKFERKSMRRSSMPEKMLTLKYNFRRTSITEKMRGMFKRSKSPCEYY